MTTVGSLCTGYDGIELGLALAGEHLDLRWYAEIEPGPVRLLADLHPDVPNLGDITVTDWTAVEPVELIVGGIPCQPVSAAGRRLGDADPRWLWPHARRALEIMRPQRFLLENVRRLVCHDKGRLFAGILNDLNALGYGVCWLTVGACAVGLAHHRHRVFLLAKHDIHHGPAVRLDVPECGAPRRAQLLPTPRASDGTNGGPNQAGRRGDLALPSAVQPERWGRFAGAILRQTEITGVAPPEPTESNRNGNPRLRAEFVEWLMAVPAGHVTDHLDRKAAIKALGNGVVPLQMAEAWRQLTNQLPTNYRQHPNASTMTGDDDGEQTRRVAERGTPQPRRGRPETEGRHGDPTPGPGGDRDWDLDDRTDAHPADAGPRPRPGRDCSTDRVHDDGAQRERRKGRSLMAATTEELRLEAERMANARRSAVIAAQDASGDLGPYDSGHYVRAAKALHAGIIAMAESWRAKAVAAESSRKKAEGVSFRNGLRAAAELAAGFAGGLISPEFLATLDNAEPQQPALSDVPGSTIEYPEAFAAAELDMAPTSADADQILAYLKDETNVVPEIPAPTVAPALPTFEIVDPVPAAPPRMTWDEFSVAVADLPVPANGSFSMITSLAECGMRYALDRLARRGIVAAPEIPAWWNVGGNAFHLATETIERWYLSHPDEHIDPASETPADLWRGAFAKAIAEEQHKSGVPTEFWRAAKKGLENHDWWRVNGVEMVRKYVAYHTPEYRKVNRIFVMSDGNPALELKLSVDLAGWPFDVVIDQVWKGASDKLRIRDLKSGGTPQAGTFQLGGYAWALNNAIIGPSHPGHEIAVGIAGAFWDARAGLHDHEVDDLLVKHPLRELTYRAWAARSQTEYRAYLPRVVAAGFGSCGSCSRRDLCPAQG